MNWLELAVVGGMIGLDATSFPQIMISRPLVAAILGGLAAGQPGLGAAVGIVVEAFHLAILPIGASRYPEAGTAAAAAAFGLAAATAGTGPAALLLTLGFALLWGRVAAVSVGVTRNVNERLVLSPGIRLGAGGVELRHMAAMAVDFVRGAAITVAGAAVARGLLAFALASFSTSDVVAQGGLALLLSGAAAGALTVFGGWSERWRSFLAGAAIGTALVLLA